MNHQYFCIQDQQQGLELYEQLMNSSNQLFATFTKQHLYHKPSYKPAFHTLPITTIDSLFPIMQNTEILIKSHYRQISNIQTHYGLIVQLQRVKQTHIEYDQAWNGFLKGIASLVIVCVVINCGFWVVQKGLQKLFGIWVNQTCPAIDQLTPTIISKQKFPGSFNTDLQPLIYSTNFFHNTLITPFANTIDQITKSAIKILIELFKLVRIIVLNFSVFVVWIVGRYLEWQKYKRTKRSYEEVTEDLREKVEQLRCKNLLVMVCYKVKNVFIDRKQRLFSNHIKSI